MDKSVTHRITEWQNHIITDKKYPNQEPEAKCVAHTWLKNVVAMNKVAEIQLLHKIEKNKFNVKVKLN